MGRLSFINRSSQFEMMDDLSCGGALLDQTLHELEVINKLLGGNQVTLNGLNKLLHNKTQQAKLVIADLGCGGGDMLQVIDQWAQRKNIQVDLLGIDANPSAITYAQKRNGKSNIRFKIMDIHSDDFQDLKVDIIICTLFLHHFEKNQLIRLFQQFYNQASLGLIINDLHRHWLAYYSIKYLTRILSKSDMVKNDAPVSVLRGFKQAEIKNILNQAGIDIFSLSWMWAFRWQLIIDKRINGKKGTSDLI